MRTKLKRTKYKLREKYRKYLRRFKKASLIKQIGYITIFMSLMVLLAVGFRFLLVNELIDDFTEPTTQPITAIVTTKPPPDAPVIEEWFLRKDIETINDNFEAGFDVRLPRLVSESRFAATINDAIAALRDDTLSKYEAAGDLSTYRMFHKIEYDAYRKDRLVFVALYVTDKTLLETGKVQTEESDPVYYSFDYVDDKPVKNNDIPRAFSLSEEQIINIINAYFIEVGNLAVETTEGITYFVRSSGRLYAEVPIKNLNGSITYSRIPLN